MLQVGALSNDPVEAVRLGAECAPYISRLIARNATAMEQLAEIGPVALIDEACKAAFLAGGADGIDEAMVTLRGAKQVAHLAIAAGDLSGALTQTQVTEAITRFADVSLQAALTAALVKRGYQPAGLFIIALGKMGAGELNYSSDIDVAAFYDPDVFDGGERHPGDAATRVLKDVAKIMEERTGDGYVFRTDLRLRPDPSSTPLAVSIRMAEVYYESVGQNWERMVWIKARPCAGDEDCARQFLEVLRPFVWRRHLDYWAIGDIHAIKRMVNAKVRDPSLSNPAAHVKLGPGGIREIEFFAQTQQLILGGRNEGLRLRGTLETLGALAEMGVVETDTQAQLTEAYHALRAVEHRIQMLGDEQTHTLPEDTDERLAVARLCGIDELAVFDAAVLATRRYVHGIYQGLFADEEVKTAEAEAVNLVFTGVDDDPGTVQTLSAFGFSQPARVIETIRHWHRGHTSATRTSRGRGLLTAILPGLLRAMSETGEADTAFLRFEAFFEHLPSGVQTLSMLLAEPALMEDLVTTLALAPALAATLGKRPALLEALIDPGALREFELAPEMSFEEAMDAARRYHRERSFLIGHRMLHGLIGGSAAGEAFSALADALVIAMAAAAERETIRKFGPAPGLWSVSALGKLGGREMTATSDLDLLVIYRVEEDGAPQQWFTRFTQRLITALSAPTGEGALYEVDMRLRPSGNAGPVAVRLNAFERYQREDAWTWEHMALTRLRPIAGDAGLLTDVVGAAQSVLAAPDDPAKISADIADMRVRLAKEKADKAGLWELKQGSGGLIDVEFVVQQALLLRGGDQTVIPSTQAALDSLETSGDLAVNDVDALRRAHRKLHILQQILRLAVGDKFDPEAASSGLKSRLARGLEVADFAAAETELSELKSAVTAIRAEKITSLATDSASQPV